MASAAHLAGQVPEQTATPPAQGGKAPHRLNSRYRMLRIASICVTLLLWELFGRQVNPIFVSYPSAIVGAIPGLIASGQLVSAVSTSLQGLVLGFGLAIVLGTTLGLLMGRYRSLDVILDTQISALYSTPTVALVPILIMWVGLGLTAKILVIFLSALFPIVLSTHGGVRNVSQGLVEIAAAEGANERQIFSKIILPASLPFIMTGIRLAAGRAVVGMVVAEMFTAMNGLGGAIVFFSNAFATDKVFVMLIVLVILGLGLTELTKLIERRVAVWKETERAS